MSGCVNIKNQFSQAEAQAKQKRLGYWNQPSPVMPWNFRQVNKGNGDRASGSSASSPTTKGQQQQPQVQ